MTDQQTASGAKTAAELTAQLDASIDAFRLPCAEEMSLAHWHFDQALELMLAHRGHASVAQKLAEVSIELGRSSSQVELAVRTHAGRAGQITDDRMTIIAAATSAAITTVIGELQRLGLEPLQIRMALFRHLAGWACMSAGENQAIAELEMTISGVPRVAKVLGLEPRARH